MKTALLITFCAIQSIVFGHDYFFAFAEVDYNDITQKFESTLVISSHDLEQVLHEKNLSLDSIPSMDENSALSMELLSIVTEHFHITCGETETIFSLIGAELLFSGVVQIYLESTPINLTSSIDVSFDLLMQRYPQQQNKITLYYQSNTYTATFMRDNTTHQIVIDNI